MLGTAEAIPTTVAQTAPPVRRALGDLTSRTAGFGALAFVGVVVLQNVLRGSSAPANGATSDEVLSYYADHRALTFVLVATFVLSGTALAVFLGGALRRLLASTRPGWAYTGPHVGALGVMTLFAVMLGCEQALSVVADGDGTRRRRRRGPVGPPQQRLHRAVAVDRRGPPRPRPRRRRRRHHPGGLRPARSDRLRAARPRHRSRTGHRRRRRHALRSALGLVGFLIWLAFLATTGLRLVRAEGVTA